jgi:tetratricopeptide (TPR) repeat protein
MPYFGAATLADVLKALRSQPLLPASGAGFVSTVNQHKDPTVVPAGPAGPAEPPANPAEPPVVENPLARLGGMTHTAAALWVAAELADGLAHAHDRGILHRDLKPANVLMADDGRPMLLDFNLAADAGGPADGVGGTPFYMAPEQLAALDGGPASADVRADVYSLGLLLYELLTGRPPTAPPTGSAAERLAALRLARASPPPPARRRNPAVTPAVDAILAHCLHPDPARRYPSCRHLAEDLRSQLADRPLPHTGEPSARERAGKWLRRNPWARSLPFAAAVVAAVAAGGAASYAVRTRQYEAAAARSALAEFRQRHDGVRQRLLDPAAATGDLRAGIAEGRDLLGGYGLPADPAGWARSKPARPLAAEDRAALAGELGRLAYLTAAAEAALAERAATPSARAAALAAAAALNGTAAALLGDDHAPLIRAQASRLRGVAVTGPDGPADTELTAAEAAAGRRYSAALDRLRAGEATAGSKAWYWLLRGRLHAARGDHPAAAACYTTALALRPAAPAVVRAERGRELLADRAYRPALADFDAALADRPDDAATLRNRALARLGLGDTAGALADLDRAEPLDPGHTRVCFMRAQVAARAGDRAAAAKHREDGLTRTPGDETSWVARGVARLAADPAGAVADFDQALALDPLSHQALQNKANALAERLSRPAEAVAVLDRLVAAHPEYAPARAGRAVVLARLGNREAAHADAVAVLQLDPTPFTRYQMAGVYALTSGTHPADKAEALRLLASALQDREGLRQLPGDRDLDPLRADPGFHKLVVAAQTLAEVAGR